MVQITAFDLAMRFVGVKEIKGALDNPQILAMLRLDDHWPENDEVPWCSAFVNYICWLLRLPRSRSLAARSWLEIGRPISLSEAKADSDIVILSRGSDEKSGHVGFFASCSDIRITILGGNQGDKVGLAEFDIRNDIRLEPIPHKLLGIRRL